MERHRDRRPADSWADNRPEWAEFGGDGVVAAADLHVPDVDDVDIVGERALASELQHYSFVDAESRCPSLLGRPALRRAIGMWVGLVAARASYMDDGDAGEVFAGRGERVVADVEAA